MKTKDMFKRVENLSEKLRDTTTDGYLQVDINHLSEAEKALFRKCDELELEYAQTGNEEILIKNTDLFYKNIEILYNRITELYCSNIPKAICGETAIDFEIINYFFKLHFMNFEKDLFECVKNLCKWDDSDKEKFLFDLRKHGPFYFRIARGLDDCNCVAEGKEDNEIAKESKEDNGSGRSALSREQGSLF